MMVKSINIISVEAKDIILSMKKKPTTGYMPRYAKGKHKDKYNLNRFYNTFDYSLETIELEKIYKKKYRNNRFTFKKKNHIYTNRIVNVTFKYSLYSFNKATKDIYVKAGYDLSKIENKFDDCLCIIDNEIVAINVNKEVISPSNDLPKGFIYDKENNVYKAKNIPIIKNVKELRNELYNNGFLCDGIKFVRFKRSGGSARVGKVLFIDENLYKPVHKWELCGLDIKEGDEIDLAAFEAYISLTTSAIIDTIEIKPENILLIDDYESVFEDNVVETRLSDDNTLKTLHDKSTIRNSIFDGESLMDISMFKGYEDKGMLLLRNQFFKSCAFNTNIQKWFEDHNITDVSQLNGLTRAKDIKDIKLITTPNSIKYLKFGTFDMWLDNISPIFGIVKYDKPTHYINGEIVQVHYQLLNSLQLTKDEAKELLEPSFKYMDMIKDDPDILKYHIKYPYSLYEEKVNDPVLNKNEIFYKMVGINSRFKYTKIYREFVNETLKAFTKNMRKGHIFVKGNYSTICGNPIEMLQQAIGTFKGESVLGVGNFSTKMFDYGKDILACRSPHVCAGCVLIHKNVKNDLIDKYMNGTKTVIYINSINENILMQLAGADFDSDTVLITDNKVLLSAAKRNYGKFLIPTNNIDSVKLKRKYTNDEKCDLDIKTSCNEIGSIINLSQELNTLCWHKLNSGASFDEVEDIYLDICQLSNMSNIEIDKAKKEFAFNNSEELNKLSKKYHRTDNSNKTIKPYFFSYIQKYKGYYNPEKNSYVKHKTTMDFVEELINKKRRSRNIKNVPTIKFAECIKPIEFKGRINYGQIEKVINEIKNYRSNVAHIFMDNDLTGEEKMLKYENIKEDVSKSISKIKFNNRTIYYLLTLLDRDSYSDVYKTLFVFLFSYPNSSFIDIIKDDRYENYDLVEDKSGDIDLFGVKFTKVKV